MASCETQRVQRIPASPSRRAARLLAIALLMLLAQALLRPSLAAHAASIWYVATTGADSSTCGSTPATACRHIQYTIINRAAAGDTVSIGANTTTAPTYNELVTVSENLTLAGASASSTIIDGTGLSGSVISIAPGVTATISGLTIQHGSGHILNTGGTVGGGIFADTDSTLTVSNSVISNNVASSASGAAAGGGIYSMGASLTIINSNISNNTASSTSASGFTGGGGIAADTLTMMGASVSDNQATSTASNGGVSGGGIACDCLVRSETASVQGTLSQAPVWQARTTIYSTPTIVGLDQAGARSGASPQALTPTGMFIDSTISGNSATDPNSGDRYITGGGGVFLEGGGTFTNDTIARNRLAAGSIAFGGGIYLDGAAPSVISFSTLNDNSAVASTESGTDNILNSFSGESTVTFREDIFALTSAGANERNCAYGAVPVDAGYNLEYQNGKTLTTATDCGLAASHNDVLNANPLPGPLALNQASAGTPFTEALLPGSPAINAGGPGPCTDAFGNTVATDERGFVRPDPASNLCDIGAFEVERISCTVYTALRTAPGSPDPARDLGIFAQDANPPTPYPIHFITFSGGSGVGTFTTRDAVVTLCTGPGTPNASATIVGTLSSTSTPSAFSPGDSVSVTVSLVGGLPGPATVTDITTGGVYPLAPAYLFGSFLHITTP